MPIVSTPIQSASLVTVANGVDSRIAAFHIAPYSHVAVRVANLGGGGSGNAAFIGAFFAVSLSANSELTGAPASGDINGNADWSPLNATEFPTATTHATLAYNAATYLLLETHGATWLDVVAQGNAGTTRATAEMVGVLRPV